MNAHLSSVSSRIGGSILNFYGVNRGREFHANDLRQHVSEQTGLTAPASADRVMRDLRQKGKLQYIVVNRAGSLYRFDE